VDRPASLEEIIRSLGGDDLLKRFDIDTVTPIVYAAPRYRPLTIDDCEREIADSNTIEIRYSEAHRSTKLDSRIRKTMKGLKIDTVHTTDGCVQNLRLWAAHHGKKVRIVQEE